MCVILLTRILLHLITLHFTLYRIYTRVIYMHIYIHDNKAFTTSGSLARSYAYVLSEHLAIAILSP